VTTVSHPPRFDPSALARIPAETLRRYDVPGPRYTSYPTAPAWTDSFGEADYVRALEKSAASRRPLSVYVHVPFCESLCVYCGCNVVITQRRDKPKQYLEDLAHETARVADLCEAAQRETVQIAWGGGTPTHLTPEQIEALMADLVRRFPLAKDAEVGIEVDPRVTTRDHVKAIVRAGFNRISMGIQDFDPAVQKEIHRVQPFELTRDFIGWCRAEGLKSVNVDLVYGLPLQSAASFDRTIDLVLGELAPDRVSAFSYAHVPWLKPAQKKFDEATIPHGPEKFAIFTRLVERMTGAGYEFVGMDHFARPDNELAVAQREGKLWRNFQGFTTKAGTDLVGLGVTSIGQVAGAFAQNEKDLLAWGARVREGRLAVTKGMWIGDDDLVRQRIIHQIMCTYRLSKRAVEREFGIDFDARFGEALERLGPLVDDGMVVPTDDGFELTSWGRVFVRNVCMLFDAHLPQPGQRAFSRTL
jgi:oxygen-independent coproporphyrinogen III oxidase